MNGDSIRTAGNANATAAYKQSIEAGMGNIATMNQDSKGNWTMSSLTEDQQMSMTGAHADMYKSLNTMIGDSKTASFNLIDQSSTLSNQILIGDNGAAPAGYTVTPGVHTIDMGDVKNMGTTEHHKAVGGTILRREAMPPVLTNRAIKVRPCAGLCYLSRACSLFLAKKASIVANRCERSSCGSFSISFKRVKASWSMF